MIKILWNRQSVNAKELCTIGKSNASILQGKRNIEGVAYEHRGKFRDWDQLLNPKLKLGTLITSLFIISQNSRTRGC